jgi:hypothetical protein
MSEIPIEFAGDRPRDLKGPTEYGGGAGLIEDGSVVGADGTVYEHIMTGSEMRGVLVRGEAPVIPTGNFQKDGVELVEFDEGADAVDPVTGRIVDPAWNEDGRTARGVESPPPTENP